MMSSHPHRRVGGQPEHHPISIPPITSPATTPHRPRPLSELTHHNPNDRLQVGIRSFSRVLLRKIRLFSLLGLFLLGVFYYYRAQWAAFFSWRVGPSLPPVTRDVLDHLDRLQATFEPADDDQPFQPSDELDDDLKMPMVTSLPGKPQPQQHSNSNSASPSSTSVAAQIIDPITCPVQHSAGLPCLFLLPGFVGEQETKAQIHLHQLGLLALQLNRTLVLPNVSKSRMGTCLAYPFDLYYHTQALSNLGIPTITYADFLNWTLIRAPSPSAQLVSVLDGKNTHAPPDGSVRLALDSPEHVLPTKPERNLCLNKGKSGLNFTSYFPLTISSPERWHNVPENREKFASTIIESLRHYEALAQAGSTTGRNVKVNQLASQPAQVLALNYDIRHPVFQTTDLDNAAILPTTSSGISPRPLSLFQHFPYASAWTEVADMIVRQLPPYVGIHWRQETLPVENLQHCAHSLIPRLRALKRSYPSLGAIYLSTDYPIEEVTNPTQASVAHSGTFSKLLTPQHHQLMKQLGRDLEQELHELRFVTFDRALTDVQIPDSLIRQLVALPNVAELLSSARAIPPRRDGSNSESELERDLVHQALARLDPGLVGIIEKTIAIRSNVFVTGVPGECSKASSFTRQIVDSRAQRIEIERGGIMDGDYSQLEEDIEEAEMKEKVLNLVEYWDANEEL